jgi:trehalose 2-sulfotransferase
LTSNGLRIHEVIPFVEPPALAARARTSAFMSPGSGHCQPAVSCFIATSPRSGSWFLAEALANTGRVGIPNEYFRPDFTALWSAEWGLTGNVPYRTYVAAAKERTMTPNGVFSAKLHWYQFAWLLGLLATEPEPGDGSPSDTMNHWFPNLRYVFLRRRDTARQAVSYYRASKTQVWFQTDKQQHGVLAEDDVDLQQIRWFEDVLIKHRENWRSYFTKNGIIPLEVIYEDLVSDYPAAVHEILAYLGIRGSGDITLSPPSLRRQSDQRTEAILERYRSASGRLVPSPDGLFWSAADKRFRVRSPEM